MSRLRRADGTLYAQSICPYTPQANWGDQLLLINWAEHYISSELGPYQRRVFSVAMKVGQNVQRATCTCMGTGLVVRGLLCTSSQLAWTCKVPFARSSSREIQSIDILVPKTWYHVPHPSNDQNMSKMTSFQRQKRRFLDGVRRGVLRRKKASEVRRAG